MEDRICRKCFFSVMKFGYNGNDGWMDDLRFYVHFNSVSVISGPWEVDN